MKRLGCLFLAICLIAASLTGCKSKRQAFNVNLEKYITLSDYKSIVVDRSSEEYIYNYDYFFENYVYNYDAYAQVKEGTVAEGDVLNIDFVGKIDGKEFDGGSATGYTLQIGSDAFIDGFEDGLVDKNIGSTVDLNLTFPKEYDASVAGKDVVFTVTINYKRELPEINSDLATKLGFDSEESLKSHLDVKTTKNCIVGSIIDNSTVNKYSDDDKEIVDEDYNDLISKLTTAATNYGCDLDTFIQGYYGMTSEQYKNQFYLQNLDYPMVMYAVFDMEGLSLTDDIINDYVNDIAAKNSKTADEIKNNYSERQLEIDAVIECVLDHLMDIITIK